jgi:hypothetical protein
VPEAWWGLSVSSVGLFLSLLCIQFLYPIPLGRYNRVQLQPFDARNAGRMLGGYLHQRRHHIPRQEDDWLEAFTVEQLQPATINCRLQAPRRLCR